MKVTLELDDKLIVYIAEKAAELNAYDWFNSTDTSDADYLYSTAFADGMREMLNIIKQNEQEQPKQQTPPMFVTLKDDKKNTLTHINVKEIQDLCYKYNHDGTQYYLNDRNITKEQYEQLIKQLSL